jgi:WD40 repeat protein
MRGHTGTVRVLKFRNGDVGPVLAASAGGGDCQPRLWDVSTGTRVCIFICVGLSYSMFYGCNVDINLCISVSPSICRSSVQV